jgi:hypothetical protein
MPMNTTDTKRSGLFYWLYFLVVLSYLFLYAIEPPRFLTMTVSVVPFVVWRALGGASLPVRVHAAAAMGLATLCAFLITYHLLSLMEPGAGMEEVMGVISHAPVVVICYLIGFYSAEPGVKRGETAGIWLLLVVVVGSTLYASHCVIMSGGLYTDRLGARVFDDYWGTVHAATGLMFKGTSGIAILLGVVAINRSTNRKMQWLVRVIIGVCAVASFYSVLRLGNRGGFVILVAANACVALVIVWHVFRSGWKVPDISFLAVVLVALGGLYGLSRIELSDTLLFQRLERSGMSSGGRLEAQSDVLTGIMENPLGGKRTILDSRIAFAHNLWADVAYETGIIPLVLIIAFNLQHLVPTVRVLANPNSDLLWKSIVAGLLGALFVAFCVEPVLEGMLQAVCVYCMICGMVQRMNIEQKLERLQQGQPETSRNRRIGSWDAGRQAPPGRYISPRLRNQ